MAAQAQANQVVSIPGLKNRPPKEISVKNLAYIIEARMEEIIDIVLNEIAASGFLDKMTQGVVLTGGGAQLNSLKELFEMRTGLECRLGYPTEHLGKSKLEAMKNPMFSTSIGLVMAGFRSVDDRENQYNVAIKQNYIKPSDEGFGRKPKQPEPQKPRSLSSLFEKTRELLAKGIDTSDFT
jgi:cell division protein FtsA